MKFFKSKNTIKTSKRWTWIAILLTGVVSIGIISCSDDDPSVTDTDPVEVESAWVLAYRSETPQGRVYYMEVNETIPSESNVSNAVELGLNNRIYSFGENPLTWNGDAGTITRWNVDRTNLDLSVDAILSFASNGVTGNIGAPIFLSETRAFMQNLAEGVIVEWNPTTMEITTVYNVSDFPEVPGGTGQYIPGGFTSGITSGGKIIYPIEYRLSTCCEYVAPQAAIVGVFDPETGTLEYKQDGRSLTSNSLVQNQQGDNYISPSAFNSFVETYYNVDPQNLPGPYTILKVDDNGNFDPNFSFDLKSVLPIEIATGFNVIFEDKIVLSYVDSNEYQLPDEFDQRFAVFGAATFNSVAVDLETGEVLPFDAFDGYNYSGFPATTDGDLYIVAGITAGPGGAEESFFLRQNGFNDFTVVSSHVGGTMQHIGRLW